MGAGKMNPSRLVAWGLMILAAIAVVFLVINFWHALTDWTPWSDKSRRERAEATAATATSNSDARTLESEGQADQMGRVQDNARLTVTVHTITAEAVANARNATDANTPLDPERVGRLRDADRRLCDARPLAGCPAPADAS